MYYKGIWEKITRREGMYIGYSRRNGNSSRFITYDEKGDKVLKMVFDIWLTSIETPPIRRWN